MGIKKGQSRDRDNTGYKTEQKQTIHIKTRDCVTPMIILFIYLQVYRVRDISY